MEFYYQIVEEGKEDKQGNIIKLSVNGLEMVAGEPTDKSNNDLLEKMEILHNTNMILDINENYKFFVLEEDRAKLLIEDWGDYVAYGRASEDWRDM